jgi:hypothetical protein
MKQESSDRFIGLFTSCSASRRLDRMANHLPLLLSMSPWTAPAQRLIVTIRLSQELVDLPVKTGGGAVSP